MKPTKFIFHAFEDKNIPSENIQEEENKKLEEIYQQHYEEGYNEGLQKGEETAYQNIQKDHTVKISNTIQEIEKNFSIFVQNIEKIEDEYLSYTKKIISSLIDKLMPSFFQSYFEEQICQETEKIIKKIKNSFTIKITTHPEYSEPIEKKLHKESKVLFDDKKVIFLKDETLEEYKACITYDHTNIEVDFKKMIDSINHFIEEAE